MVVAPTGAGKTVIACSVMESVMMKLRRCAFFAHRGELINQTCDKLTENGLTHGVIKAGDPRWNPGALLQVGSVQTVVSRLHRLDLKYDMVIFDECHRAMASTYQKIAAAIEAENPDCIFIGLTATPYRSDGKGLGDFFDVLIEVSTVEWLIDNGFLVPPIQLTGRKLDLSGIRTTGGDWNVRDLSERMAKPKVVGHIVEEWLKHAPDRLTVAFLPTVDNAIQVARAFRDAGIRAEHVEGGLKPEERAAVFGRWRAGETRIVTNCQLVTEGYDFPEISAVILARATKSRGLWKQMVGRGLRIAPGKEDCKILDHANCRDAHGYVTEPDKISLQGGISNERPRPERRCPACRAKFAGAPSRCPDCGAELKRAGGERCDEELPGLRNDGYVLVEDEAQPLAPRPKRRMPLWLAEKKYREDIETERAKNYKPGWAAHRFEAATGYPPPESLVNGSPIRSVTVMKDGRKERVVL